VLTVIELKILHPVGRMDFLLCS